MGAYLSSPVCDKETVEESNKRLAYAASSMQGWRMSQEDAHNAILDFDSSTKTSLFAVYDGHGGAEIALYCSRHLPDFIKQLDSYREGRMKDALIEGFLKFDALLLEPNVKEILQELANAKEGEDDDNESAPTAERSHQVVVPIDANQENNHNDELNVEEAQMLKKEAELPLHELLKQYSSANEEVQHFHSPNISKRVLRNPLAKTTDTTDEEQEKVKNLQKLKDIRESSAVDDDAVSSTSLIDTEKISDKSDVVTHGDEENTPTDDVLDQKIAETTTNESSLANGDTSAVVEPRASSSEPKPTARRPRKPVSTDVTTITTTTTTAIKSSSLTRHLLSDNLDELQDDDDEDEDDFEFDASDEQTSGDEAEEHETDSENASGDEDDDGEENEEEEEEGDEKPLTSSKAAQIEKLMTKSILAILNRRAKKKKHATGGDEDDVKENQHEDQESDDDDDDDEEEDDDENGPYLSKMLDMNGDPGSSSGCTAVVTLLRDKELFVANAGDSRCVICRGGRAIEMSIDHKPEDAQERNRIEKAGYKVTLDGRVSGGLNLSRAIGDHAYKKTASLPAEEQAITALPDVRTLTLEEQDEFMVIACDGIWNFMSSQDVVDFVRIRMDKANLSQICEELFMHCLAPNTSGDGTGCDNMTAIIVKLNVAQKSAQSTDDPSAEHSPWPTMFTSPTAANNLTNNNKRPLSPDSISTIETADTTSSKKLKILPENGVSETTSPTKTMNTGGFSFLTAANNSAKDDEEHLSS